MSAPVLQVRTPSGAALPLPPPSTPSVLLSAWLEEGGFPLNTRCGGRGLCRGCLVGVETPAGSQELRACQHTAGAVPPEASGLVIPPGSLRDNSIHGVSSFELRHVGPAPALRPGHGLALDIGTTTVAGALWDFSSGRCIASASVANAQIAHGDNVVARIGFSLTQPDGLARLQALLADHSLHPLIDGLCASAGIPAAAITEAAAVGNPAMLHILAGESLEGLGTFPFRPVFLSDRWLPAGQPELSLSCPVHLLPGLAPFVGADISAGALASGMLTDEGPVMLVDFGTNGEILLKHAGGYLCTATAAGPAFEGGRLRCGSTARNGAISSLEYQGGQWQWGLSGGGSGVPHGITGAAYVDFIALGLRAGFIDGRGRFDSSHPAVRTVQREGRALRRIPLSDTVHVAETDVAELLQAKAAISAGVRTLLQLAGLEPSDLRTLYVGGGFGYHLNPANARAIGLLPELPLERIAVIGNSALGGASLLLHPEYRDSLEWLLASTTNVELNQVPFFEDNYVDALSLAGPGGD